MSRSLIGVVLVVAGAMPGLVLADGAFRCGSKLIEPGMTQSQVLSHCGEPTSRSVEKQDVRSGNRVVGQTDLHRWTYESFSAIRTLVFDQDQLRSIE